MTSPNSESLLSLIESEELISIEKIYDAEPDETIVERIAGLLEMFHSGKYLWSCFKTACDAAWISFITAAILIGPVLVESEIQSVNESPNKSENSRNDL